MTINPAKAIHREASLGSIGVARDADVTILKVSSSLVLTLIELDVIFQGIAAVKIDIITKISGADDA